ncbi:MAG: hypothetical protein UX58_C0001G0143 [Candidatus Wolfebacteria bacterium GW2011_GWB2_46_69]|nr:MAG: hypothetical protein UX58_C0001G0143 [Candidatus Wolfebacteria bacterium GW2011_GWB2_46_69]
MIAPSNLFPATRKLAHDTIPPNDTTAVSVVPPPILTIILPECELIGMPAPNAASIGSRTMYASRAPASFAALTTARRSVCVIPAGTEMTISGLNTLNDPTALVMKYFNIALVM